MTSSSPRYVQPPDPLLPTLPANTESSIVLTTGVNAGETYRVATSELTKAVGATVTALTSRVSANESAISSLGSRVSSLESQVSSLNNRVSALEAAKP